ncbi:MAG: methyltransferase [Armatimonadota bacterium]
MKKRGIEKGFNIPLESSEDIFRISRAFEYSLTLHTANNIDLFTELATGSMTADDLSLKLGMESSSLKKIMIACTAMGLLITDGEKFSNSLLSSRYLVKESKDYIGDGIWLTGTWWTRLDDFANSITLRERSEDDQLRSHYRFIRAMHEFAASGDAQFLVDSIDLSGRQRLLDLGGGPGTYSAFLCMRYPELSADIFDLPESEPVFNEIQSMYKLQDRMIFIPGDLETDSIGSGYDAVLVSNMMHGSRGEIIPPKVYDALNPGGIILIRDFVLYPDLSGPLSAALFNMRMGAYTEDEMIDYLQKAGFTHISCKELGDSTLITGHKPD